jgi:hypothetical protein
MTGYCLKQGIAYKKGEISSKILLHKVRSKKGFFKPFARAAYFIFMLQITTLYMKCTQQL